jgi:hypothetical protein
MRRGIDCHVHRLEDAPGEEQQEGPVPPGRRGEHRVEERPQGRHVEPRQLGRDLAKVEAGAMTHPRTLRDLDISSDTVILLQVCLARKRP